MSPKKEPKKPQSKENGEKQKKIIFPKEDEIRPLDETERPFSIEELRESISWSTRIILLEARGCSTLFNIVALTEKKKYGTKTSVKIGEYSNDCVKASLSLMDNLIFLPSIDFEGAGKLTKKEQEKGIKKKIILKSIPAGLKRGIIRIDEEGDYVHRREIEEYDGKDRLLPVIPSSLHFKNSQTKVEITDVATVEEILNTDVSSRYFLFPEEGENDQDFKDLINNLERVDSPQFLTFKFNYTESTQQKDAYLMLVEENGTEYILMCIGTKLETQWVGLEEIPEENMYISEDLEFELDLSL